jgi:DNA polymerase-3 subunit gamma/tau
VQLFYQIGLIGQRDLPLAPDPRAGFEMVLLRMLAFRPQGGGEGSAKGLERDRSDKKKRSETAPPVAVTAAARAAIRPDAKAAGQPAALASVVPAPERVASPVAAIPERAGNPVEFRHWHQVVDLLSLGGIAKQLANNCVYDYWDGVTLSLKLDQAHQHMLVGSTEQRLHAALQAHLGRELKLKITPESVQAATPAKIQAQAVADRQQAAEVAIREDPMVLALEAGFGATVIPGSVRPVDESPG